MGLFYTITLGIVGMCIAGISYHIGRIVEHRHSRTRGVTLSEFHNMTQQR